MNLKTDPYASDRLELTVWDLVRLLFGVTLGKGSSLHVRRSSRKPWGQP